MDSRAPNPLRVLIANERKERLQTTTGLVAAMSHEVIARSLEVSQVAAATAETRPDVPVVDPLTGTPRSRCRTDAGVPTGSSQAFALDVPSERRRRFRADGSFHGPLG